MGEKSESNKVVYKNVTIFSLKIYLFIGERACTRTRLPRMCKLEGERRRERGEGESQADSP